MTATSKNRIMRMNRKNNVAGARKALLMAGLIAVAATLAGCLSAEEQRQVDLNRDVGTCSDFGARYGSPEHYQCMLLQQQRRDRESMDTLERMRISSEIARNNMEMVEERERRRR